MYHYFLIFIITGQVYHEASTLEVIDVVNNTSYFPCKSLSANHFICNSLYSACQQPNISNTIINVIDDQWLERIINVNHTASLKITSNTSARIFCKESGLLISKSNDIHVSDIEFIGCGIKGNSTSLPVNGTVPTISTAFRFEYVQTIHFSNVTFSYSKGYSIVLYDSCGEIQIERVHINDSQLVGTDHIDDKGYHSGGGIYFEYTDRNRNEEYRSNAHIKVNRCVFFNNSAETFSVRPRSEGLLEPHIPFGRGAGLTLFFLGNSSKNTISVSKTSFLKNTAAWGGGVYIRFRGRSWNNQIVFTDCLFSNNIAKYSGGGIIVTSTQMSEPFHNTVSFHYCNFQSNQARTGGGMFLNRLDVRFRESEKTICYTCKFIDNFASIGAAMQLKHMKVSFKSALFRQNNKGNCSGLTSTYGALFLYKSLLAFSKVNLIERNECTAMLLDCSNLYVRGNLSFIDNKGTVGGALILYGHSKIYLNNKTSLAFVNNTATKKGAAIHVSITGASHSSECVAKLQSYECFFQFEGSNGVESHKTFNGTVKFINNTAIINGDSIFATTLCHCRSNKQTSLRDVIINWKGFSVPNNTIATRPLNIIYHKKDWLVWPGKLFRPYISLQDEVGNNVSEMIDVRITSEKHVVSIETNNRFVVANNSIMLRLISKEWNQTIDVDIIVVKFPHAKVTISNIALQPCYFGYSLDRNGFCKCNVKKNRARGISLCYHGDIYLFNGRWAYPKQSAVSYDQEKTNACPDNYCNNSCPTNHTITKYECLFKPGKTKQCVKNRNQTSFLCGECEENFSVAFGGENCVSCKGIGRYNAIWIIPLIIFILTVIIWVVLRFNVDIYSNYLNGVLYYYQIVELLTISSFMDNNYLHFIRTLTNLIMLKGLGGKGLQFCLFDGLNNLWKNIFNYIFPVWIVLALVIASVWATFRSNTFIRRRNCLNAFTIISVIAYGDFTRITFQILAYVKIDKVLRVEVYASMVYSSCSYRGFLVFGCIAVIVVVLGFPILLMFSSKLVTIQCRCCPNPLARWAPIFDSFKYCFRQNYQWFACYYFFCRAVLLGIGTFLEKGPLQNLVLALVCFLICIFFTVNLPYKCIWMNTFDVMILTNLTTIAILSLGMRSAFALKQKNTCRVLIIILMYIPIAIVFGRLCYLYLPKMYHAVKKMKKARKLVAAPIPKRLLLATDQTVDDEISDSC